MLLVVWLSIMRRGRAEVPFKIRKEISGVTSTEGEVINTTQNKESLKWVYIGGGGGL